MNNLSQNLSRNCSRYNLVHQIRCGSLLIWIALASPLNAQDLATKPAKETPFVIKVLPNIAEQLQAIQPQQIVRARNAAYRSRRLLRGFNL